MKRLSNIICVLFLTVITDAHATGRLRVVVPDEDELTGYELRDGELAWDSDFDQLKIANGGQWQQIGAGMESEKLPSLIKDSSAGITVLPGKVIIGGRMYFNYTNITCSYSVTGVGGYETTDPATTGYLGYLYVVPEASPSTNFDCIISPSDSGPTTLSTTPYRKIASFYTMSNFFFDGDTLMYRASHPQIQIPAGNHTTCDQLSPTNLNDEAMRIKARVVCNGSGNASNDFNIYLDSACTVSLLGFSTCTTSNTTIDFGTYADRIGSGFGVYVKGNVQGTHYLQQVWVEGVLQRND